MHGDSSNGVQRSLVSYVDRTLTLSTVGESSTQPQTRSSTPEGVRVGSEALHQLPGLAPEHA